MFSVLFSGTHVILIYAMEFCEKMWEQLTEICLDRCNIDLAADCTCLYFPVIIVCYRMITQYLIIFRWHKTDSRNK